MFGGVGWLLFALYKILEGILRATWFIAKGLVKGGIALTKLATGKSNKVSINKIKSMGYPAITTIRRDLLENVVKQAKPYGIIKYAIPKGQKGKDVIDIVMLNNDVPLLNHIITKIQDEGQAERSGNNSSAIEHPLSRVSEKASVVGKVEGYKKTQGEFTPLFQEKGDFIK